jgi:hypothetical protein
MEFFCDQFWFCSAVPPEWHWVVPLGMPLLLIIIVAVPVANILHRAGRSRWWTIAAPMPMPLETKRGPQVPVCWKPRSLTPR